MVSNPKDRHSGRIIDFEDSLSVLNCIQDAVFCVDITADKILCVNDRGCELLGYDRDALLSLSVSDIYPTDMDALREFAETAHQSGEALSTDLHCVCNDGRTIPIEASGYEATYDDRDCIIIVVRDISDNKRQIHYMRVFERVLRHNLRNMLNIVLARAEYINEETEDETIIHQSDKLVEQTCEIADVVENIRVVQRCCQQDIEATARYDVEKAIQQVVTKERADNPGATITISVPETLAVRSDDRLRHALRHVIKNAVVHNDGNHPNVEIMAGPVDDHQCVRIQIVDDGPGIPTKERIVVTNPESTTPLKHGTGVGLWVVSMIVRSLDGEVNIEDNDTDGTTVVLRIPAANETPSRS